MIMKKEITVQIADRWEDVSLRQYEAIMALDPSQGNEDFTIALIEILSNLSRDEILALPYAEFVKLSGRLAFLNTQPATHVPKSHIVVGGKRMTVTTTVGNILAAQFIDYKSIMAAKDIDMRLARLCSCFVFPADCEYGKGYDMEEHLQFLHDNLGVVEALSLANFFMIQSRGYIDSTLRSLRRMLKKTKATTEEQRAKIQETLAALEEARRAVSVLNGGRISCAKQ